MTDEEIPGPGREYLGDRYAVCLGSHTATFPPNMHNEIAGWMRTGRGTLRCAGRSMEATRPELGTGEPGRLAGPAITRRWQALFWAFYGVAGIAQAWLLARAVERFDWSPAVIGGYALLYVGTGYFAWCGFRGRLSEPPLELGLARDPADDDPWR